MRHTKKVIVATVVLSVLLAACASADNGDTTLPEQDTGATTSPEQSGTPKIGVILISETVGYPTILKSGYEAQAKEMGADVVFCVHQFDPANAVSCGENLLSAGVDVLIMAPADEGSFDAVKKLATDKGVPIINDGSPQEGDDFIPFTGTDNLAGGQLAGRWAGEWIQANLGGEAVVAELTLPAFTDCVNRNDGFLEGLQEVIPDAEIVASADSKGQRSVALPAMENILQAHPDVNVVFACNDDAALGAVSALTSAGKDPAKTLVLGFDGTLEAFDMIKEGGMLRLDIVQRPDCYSRRAMENAVNLARGEVTEEELIAEGLYLIKTPVVTAENVDQWLKWDGTPATAPEECVRSNA